MKKYKRGYNMKKGCRKIIAMMSVVTMLFAYSLTADAACVTCVAKDNKPDNWNYVGTVNSTHGTFHPYPKVITATGEVLEWGTCETVVYTDKYVLPCRNCSSPVDTKYVTREVHTVGH